MGQLETTKQHFQRLSLFYDGHFYYRFFSFFLYLISAVNCLQLLTMMIIVQYSFSFILIYYRYEVVYALVSVAL